MCSPHPLVARSRSAVRRAVARLLITLLAGVLATPLAARAETGDPGARIDALIARHHELGRFNGTALVAVGGRIVLAKGYGSASFEFGVANDPETRHWIGSVSKVFTATAVMRLADRGALRLEQTVAELLPWYRQDTGGQVTVRHLLTHTSGIPDYMHLPGVGREGFRREVGDAPIEVRPFAEKWCAGDLGWPPGTRWGYSNSGYVLLAAIVEQVTGRPFAVALRELVLEPAGMTDTVDLAMQPRAVVERLTPGYEQGPDGLLTRRAWNLSTTYGAGSLVSTVGDLFRFDRALERPDFLSPASRAASFTEGLGHWGCGWEVRTLPLGPAGAPRLVAGHEGFLFWSIARIYRVAEDGVFVALVNNTGDAPLPALFAGIADLIYGREPAWPLPAAADEIAALASERGGAAAVARYRELRAARPGELEFDESGLNRLGYRLLGAGRATDATALFRLMVELYPQSANAWDSLGEGLAAAGERTEAIRAYARSLELDPTNSNAARQLARLAGN